MFIESPEAYTPQFEGFCAYAAAKNKLVDVDPTLYVIHKDKLYLSFNNKVRKKFSKKIDKYVDKANKHWPKLSHKIED